ncbi:hypothetical protein [Methylomicrobium agile]|uniref:hypothetical protein n=1 Tax=Methylomicrobium agile TaxID=39774 RepID=UPI0004DF1428|nr:hypothetical protein [Methylomicrobium agile]
MKKNSKVRLVQPIITGEIVEVQWDNDLDCKKCLVRYTDASGEAHERWFHEHELELNNDA